MANVMSRTIFAVAMLLILTVGAVVLQIFLSKRQNKWYGLILPIISLLFSLIWPLNMMVPVGGITMSFVFQMLIVFLLANIPTAILIVIYFACRENMKRKNRLDKMNIQDLG